MDECQYERVPEIRDGESGPWRWIGIATLVFLNVSQLPFVLHACSNGGLGSNLCDQLQVLIDSRDLGCHRGMCSGLGNTICTRVYCQWLS